MRCEVRSPIAGSIWAHVVAVGQRVESGATLTIVECMKTEVPVDAPRSGTVTWLKPCGEVVETDDLVATLDS